MRRLKIVVTALMTLAMLAVAAQAGEFSSPNGYRLMYPDGWQVASQDKMDQIEEEARKLLKDIDFQRVDVVVFNPQSGTFSENVNVVVSPSAMRIDESSPQLFAEIIEKQMDKLGFEITMLDQGLFDIGPSRAAYVKFEGIYGDRDPVRQWQFFLPDPQSENTLIITCTAQVDDFAKHEFTFRGIVGSIRFEE